MIFLKYHISDKQKISSKYMKDTGLSLKYKILLLI